MDAKKRLAVFVSFFVIAFVYFRLRIFMSFNDGRIPLLREVTGLSIHHFHFGLLVILISALMLIFYKVNFWSVGLMGFGLGSVYDSFVSRLFSFNSVRVHEVSKYNQSFKLTFFLFIIVILLSFIFYLGNRKYKKS